MVSKWGQDLTQRQAELTAMNAAGLHPQSENHSGVGFHVPHIFIGLIQQSGELKVN